MKVPGNGWLKKDLVIIEKSGVTFCSLAEKTLSFCVGSVYNDDNVSYND